MTFKGLRIFFRPDNTNRRCVGAFALLFFTVLICINFRIQRVTETRYLSGTQVRKTGNGIPVVNHGRIMEIHPYCRYSGMFLEEVIHPVSYFLTREPHDIHRKEFQS